MPAELPPNGRTFRIQLWHEDSDSDNGGYWTFYERYLNRQYVIGGGATFDDATAIAEAELAGNTYQIVDLNENPVNPRRIAEEAIDPNVERKSMIKLNVKREGGRVYLLVNAKGMHDVLDAIGVPSVGGMYSDRPRAEHSVANRSTHTISTEALLRKEYPAKFDLSTVYTDPPPSFKSLQTLTESAFEQARKILEHYQPIDISVSIQKKDK